MIKILVIGSSGTGKSSIINRFVNNNFDSNIKATVVANYSLKVINI